MEANSLLGSIVGGSSVEERKHSAKETSNRDVAGKFTFMLYFTHFSETCVHYQNTHYQNQNTHYQKTCVHYQNTHYSETNR